MGTSSYKKWLAGVRPAPEKSDINKNFAAPYDRREKYAFIFISEEPVPLKFIAS